MTLWVARAGRYGKRENFALENNVVVVGWGELPGLSGIEDRDQLLNLLIDRLPRRETKCNRELSDSTFGFRTTV